jgi:tetratricopeptide (TPR) repeat protein
MARDAYKRFEDRIYMYINAGDFAKSRRFAEKAVKTYPRDHRFYWWLGLVLHAQGRPSEAARVTARGLRVDPRCPFLQAGHAEHIGAMGQHKEAIKILDRLVRQGLRRIAKSECGAGIPWARDILCDAQFCLAMFHSTIGRYDTAARHYRSHWRLRASSTSGYPVAFVREIGKEIANGKSNRKKPSRKA